MVLSAFSVTAAVVGRSGAMAFPAVPSLPMVVAGVLRRWRAAMVEPPARPA